MARPEHAWLREETGRRGWEQVGDSHSGVCRADIDSVFVQMCPGFLQSVVELDRWLSGHLGGGTEDWRVEAGGRLRRGLQPSPDREADGMPRRVPAWACAVGRAARLRGQFGDCQ